MSKARDAAGASHADGGDITSMVIGCGGDMEATETRRGGKVDWRGVGCYLGICFGVTWLVEITALVRGVRFARLTLGTTLLLALVMLVPAASAFAVRLLRREGFGDAGLRLGSGWAYLWIWLGVPCLVAIIYLLTAALGLAKLDADAAEFLRQLPQLPAGKRLPPLPLLLAGLEFASLGAGLALTCVFTFGEEFGWTGYLLPRLLPLGRGRATLVYGVIWGLWHAPIIVGGFNYPGHPVAGIFVMCVFTCAIAMWQTALILRYRSVVLTSFLHASINCQARAIWPLLFAGVAPLWGGLAGMLGSMVLAAVGMVLGG